MTDTNVTFTELDAATAWARTYNLLDVSNIALLLADDAGAEDHHCAEQRDEDGGCSERQRPPTRANGDSSVAHRCPPRAEAQGGAMRRKWAVWLELSKNFD